MKLIQILVIINWIGLVKSHKGGHIKGNQYWGQCSSNQWPCAPDCLPLMFKCNHRDDCADRSDEYLCAGCGCTPIIPHGTVTLTSMGSSVGATADVTCDEGYETCKPYITCLPSRTWETTICSPIHRENFECYTCDKEKDNDVCNNKTEICDDEQTCHTIVVWKKDKYTITKGCTSPTNLGCQKKGKKTTCKYKCDEHLCNELMPADCADCGDQEEDDDGGQGQGGSCKKEHGPCNKRMYRSLQNIALRSSNCRKYCQCKRIKRRGSTKYKWQRKKCPRGTKFDDSLANPACNKKKRVKCHGIDENDCTKEHGICNVVIAASSPQVPLSDSGCKKYCECVIENELPCGAPLYTWLEKDCPNGKLFDKKKKKCRRSNKVSC